MIWDPSFPSDDIQAKTLDQPLRSEKVLIRERAVINNGSWNEHSFFGSNVTGAHPLSQVGWVAIYQSYLDMSNTSCPVGSLHYVATDADLTKVGLYVKGTDSFILVISLDHRNLTIGTSDIHTQYYRKDGTRPMVTDLKTNIDPFQTSPGTAVDNPMPASHESLSWYDAHGVDGELLINRHFGNNSVNLVNSEFITAEQLITPSNIVQGWLAIGTGNRKYMSIPAFSISGDPVSGVNTWMSLLMDKNGVTTGGKILGASIHISIQFGLFVNGSINHFQSYDLPPSSFMGI